MTTIHQKIFSSRLLPERARIEFHYGGEEKPIVFLPFYENPKIYESQATNYAEYNPVGRAGSLYSYLGAKSRKFKVDMTYTLPHLAQHPMGISRFLRVYSNTGVQAQKETFFMNTKYNPETLPGAPDHSLAAACQQLYKMMVADKFGISMGDNPFTRAVERPPSYVAIPYTDRTNVTMLEDVPNFLDQFVAEISTDELGGEISPSQIHGDKMTEVIDTLLLFVAVLRTSVVNNASDPMIGPPLLRLTFGSMYQNVPCLCKNYNISWEEESGYDLETLTPRNLKIQLNLEEIRVGDFEQYIPGRFIKSDNLTGWESAIASPYTTDPLPSEGFWKDT